MVAVVYISERQKLPRMRREDFFGRREIMRVKRRVMITVLAIAAIAVMGCASQPAVQARSARQAAIEAATPIRTEPAGRERPTWLDSVPDSPTTLSFTGTSIRLFPIAVARDNARDNGIRQLVEYYGTIMVEKARTYSALYGITSDVLAPQLTAQQLNERLMQNISQALATRDNYAYVYLNSANTEAFEAYVLMEVDKAIVRRVMDSYGQEQAVDYARRAAAEQDAARRQQLEKAAEFFGGNLSSTLDF